VNDKESRMKKLTTALAILAAGLCFAGAQNYSIDWYKVAGGGGTSTGATYQVSGTIGQQDAGGPMTGGNYALTGGFWSIIAVQTPGGPLLTIVHAGNGVTVSWQAVAGFNTLLQAASLSSPNWTTNTGTVNSSGGTNSVTITPATGNLYLRLRNP
jgi:hypothetical protein